jgi:antitoxin (DNA-binding transcriptional repressor) of toxin-antitoxin stability system
MGLHGEAGMIKVNVKEADLEHLIEEVAEGEEVVITGRDGRNFRLVPLTGPEPRPRFGTPRPRFGAPHPRFGSAKGRIKISEDFDEPLEDFRDYEP